MNRSTRPLPTPTPLPTSLALAAALLASALLSACHEHGSGGHEHGHDHGAKAEPAAPLPPGTNPVQNEMRLLHEALRDAVTLIADGDVRPLPGKLHRVHEAKHATGEALAQGSYKPPRNGDQIDRFKALDEAFHGDLERLVEASSKNDLAATSQALGKTLSGCDGCHREFRR